MRFDVAVPTCDIEDRIGGRKKGDILGRRKVMALSVKFFVMIGHR